VLIAPSTGPLAPFIGGLQWAGLANWAEPWGEGQLSQGAVAVFQLSFAFITPALVSGAVVECMHFGAWLAAEGLRSPGPLTASAVARPQH
jgi:ammonia channel protein AmtB